MLWRGAPNPLRCTLHGWIYAAIGPFSILAALLTTVFGLDGETRGLLSIAMIAGGIGFSLVGLGLIAVPFVLASTARGTRYAVSTLRLLIVSTNGRYCVSIGPNQISASESSTIFPPDEGSIFFNIYSNTTRDEIRTAFFAIKNPAQVWRLIEAHYSKWPWKSDYSAHPDAPVVSND